MAAKEKRNLGWFASIEEAREAVKKADPTGKIREYLVGYDGYSDTWDGTEVYTDSVTSFIPGM